MHVGIYYSLFTLGQGFAFQAHGQLQLVDTHIGAYWLTKGYTTCV